MLCYLKKAVVACGNKWILETTMRLWFSECGKLLTALACLILTTASPKCKMLPKNWVHRISNLVLAREASGEMNTPYYFVSFIPLDGNVSRLLVERINSLLNIFQFRSQVTPMWLPDCLYDVGNVSQQSNRLSRASQNSLWKYVKTIGIRALVFLQNH